MLPDRVSNPGPLTYESGALPIALRGPAGGHVIIRYDKNKISGLHSRPFSFSLGSSIVKLK